MTTADAYREFARREAHGVSPIYEQLALNEPAAFPPTFGRIG